MSAYKKQSFHHFCSEVVYTASKAKRLVFQKRDLIFTLFEGGLSRGLAVHVYTSRPKSTLLFQLL